MTTCTRFIGEAGTVRCFYYNVLTPSAATSLLVCIVTKAMEVQAAEVATKKWVRLLCRDDVQLFSDKIIPQRVNSFLDLINLKPCKYQVQVAANNF